ncbi:MAG: hypothetical protein GY756_26990 [bacterium]|nr:hypothetical protein [bacterium]
MTTFKDKKVKELKDQINCAPCNYVEELEKLKINSQIFVINLSEGKEDKELNKLCNDCDFNLGEYLDK